MKDELAVGVVLGTIAGMFIAYSYLGWLFGGSLSGPILAAGVALKNQGNRNLTK